MDGGRFTPISEITCSLSTGCGMWVVEPRMALITAIFLGVLACGFLLNDVLTPAVETCYRRAELGETEALVALLPVWNEHLNRFFQQRLQASTP